MGPRYPDCESCAFHHVEDAICDDCDDADQWEPDEPTDEVITTTKRVIHTMRFYRNKKLKEAA